MANLSVISVAVESSKAQSGAKSATSAIRQIDISLKSLDATVKRLDATLRAAGSGGGGRGGVAAGAKASSAQVNELTQAFYRLRNSLFILYVAERAFQSIGNAIRAVLEPGLRFNQQIETATTALTGLMATTLSLKQGGLELKGAERLAAAVPIATKQLNALQVAAFETSASTESLIDAYQQVFGAATRANVPLEKILDLTVDITQAAKAIGLPNVQLAQEVRAIFEGSIDRNARVAKVLGITNEQIAQFKQAGTLVKELETRFENFRIIGERVSKTLAGVVSNLQDIGSRLAGEATFPFFESLRSGLLGLQSAFTDPTKFLDARKTGDISLVYTKLTKQLIEAGSILSRGLGEGFNRALDGAIKLLQDFGDMLSRNRDGLTETAKILTALGTALGDMARQVFPTTGSFEDFNRGLAQTTRSVLGLVDAFRILISLGDRLAALGNVIVEYYSVTGFAMQGRLAEAAISLVNLRAAHKEFQATGKEFKELVQGETGAVAAFDKALAALNLTLGNVGGTAAQAGSQLRTLFQLGEGVQPFLDAQARFQGSLPGTGGLGQSFLGGGGTLAGGQFQRERSALDSLGRRPFTSNLTGQQTDVSNKTTLGGGGGEGAAKKAEREARQLSKAFLDMQREQSRQEVLVAQAGLSKKLEDLKEYYELGLVAAEQYFTAVEALERGRFGDRRGAILDRIKALQEEGSKVLPSVGFQQWNVELLEVAKTAEAAEIQLKALGLVSEKGKKGLGEEGLRIYRELINAVGELAGLEKEEQARQTSRKGSAELSAQTQSRLRAIRLARELADATEEVLDIEKTRTDEVKEQLERYSDMNRRMEEFLTIDRQRAQVDSLITAGILTQAEASERLLTLAEQERDVKLETAKAELARLNASGNAGYGAIAAVLNEIAILEGQIFRVDNYTAFFRGLQDEIGTLQDLFDDLGRAVRSSFERAFEGLIRKGPKGFVTALLESIADELTGQAARGLAALLADFLAKIFKPPQKGQASVFDKIIATVIGIFGGTKPTGSILGPIVDKIISILLDPLGKRRKAGGATGPSGRPIEEPGPTTRPRTVTGIGEEATEATARRTASATENVRNYTEEIAKSMEQAVGLLREIANCSCTRTEVTGGSPKLISILDTIASVGSAIGGINASVGYLKGRKQEMNLAFNAGNASFNPYGLQQAGGFGAYGFGTETAGMRPVTVQQVSVTVMAQDVNSFTSKKTQTQIAAQMGRTIQDAGNFAG